MKPITEATIRQLIASEVEQALARQTPDVLNAEQVAALLGLDRKTVYEYAGRGQIPHRRLGRRLLFSRSALVAWLGGCKAAGFQEGI